MTDVNWDNVVGAVATDEGLLVTERGADGTVGATPRLMPYAQSPSRQTPTLPTQGYPEARFDYLNKKKLPLQPPKRIVKTFRLLDTKPPNGEVAYQIYATMDPMFSGCPAGQQTWQGKCTPAPDGRIDVLHWEGQKWVQDQTTNEGAVVLKFVPALFANQEPLITEVAQWKIDKAMNAPYVHVGLGSDIKNAIKPGAMLLVVRTKTGTIPMAGKYDTYDKADQLNVLDLNTGELLGSARAGIALG